MEAVSTVSLGVRLTPNRASGNTTRQIDAAIQVLFDGKIIMVRDHFELGENRKINRILFDRILDRLSFEHFGGGLLTDHLDINTHTLEISIKITN